MDILEYVNLSKTVPVTTILYYYHHYPIFKCVKYNNKYNNKYNINVLLIRKFPLHTLNPKSNVNSEPKLK